MKFLKMMSEARYVIFQFTVRDWVNRGEMYIFSDKNGLIFSELFEELHSRHHSVWAVAN